MRLWWFFILVAGIFVSAPVCAQPPSIDLSDALYFENGTIANGIYSNECLGFSLPIPVGWDGNTQIGHHDGKAMPHHRGLQLLVIDRPGPNASVIGIRIEMEAYDAAVENVTPQEYVSRIAHTRNYAAERILLRDAYEVPYGGRKFFRADYREEHGSTGTLFFASIFTQFRDHLVGETVTAHSLEELDQAATSLLGILFLEDRINPNCLASPEQNLAGGGVMGDILGVTPNIPRIALPSRVRVSQGVAKTFLVRRVNPQYPEDARQNGVQGPVVLRVVIDKNGDIADLSLVSGHAMLAPAAIEAVKQWKYKPYLLNNQPVEVETQITVNFTLSE